MDSTSVVFVCFDFEFSDLLGHEFLELGIESIASRCTQKCDTQRWDR